MKINASSAIAALVFLAGASAAAAAPPAAVHAACVDDAKRLCADVFDNQKARMACMQKHHAEWSARCKAAVSKFRSRRAGTSRHAIAGKPINSDLPAGATLHEKCIAAVSDYYRYQPGTHRTAAPAALRRCQHGKKI